MVPSSERVLSMRDGGWRAGLDEPKHAGRGHRFEAALDAKLAHDAVDMALDRADCHDQLVGDRLVRAPRCKQPQHLHLALREHLTTWSQAREPEHRPSRDGLWLDALCIEDAEQGSG